MEPSNLLPKSDVEILIDLKRKAIHQAWSSALLKMYKSEIQADPQLFLDNYYPDHKGTMNLEATKLNAKVQERYQSNLQLSPQKTAALFVTYSPDPTLEKTVEDLRLIGMKLIKPSKGVTIDSMFCIEQRGTNEEDIGQGLHVHCLIVLNKEEQMGEVGKQVKRIVSMLEKDRTTTDAFLDIRRVSQEKIDDKKNYIMGNKIKPEKRDNVAANRLWRKQIGIQDYYIIPNF